LPIINRGMPAIIFPTSYHVYDLPFNVVLLGAFSIGMAREPSDTILSTVRNIETSSLDTNLPPLINNSVVSTVKKRYSLIFLIYDSVLSIIDKIQLSLIY